MIICKHTNVEFVAHIAAPGYGQSWKCVDCEEPMWAACSGVHPIPYAEMDRSPELSINDII